MSITGRLTCAVATLLLVGFALQPRAVLAYEDEASPANPLARATTLVLLRHAEKDPAGDKRDPGLSAAGKLRAEALAKHFAAAGVTHLFATEYHRTQDTLAPLAQSSGVKTTVTSGAKTAELLLALKSLPPGSVALVAGHSNTVPQIAQHFGLALAHTETSEHGAVLPEDAFDRLYVITLPPEGSKVAPALLELRY
ncbi:MAG: histidine phosphatase family protein [Planctomycetes bacterium]|nr:histidine phosphatase family protein [Planctomycetota bacterium]